MTGPRTDKDVERALAAWMHEVAPVRPPTHLLEETFIETARLGQEGARPWNRIDTGRSSRRNWVPAAPRLAPAVAAVLVVAALVVALAVALSGGAPSPKAPPTPRITQPAAVATSSASVAPSLPASISVTPEAVVTIESPIALAGSGSSLWVLALGRLDQVDPSRNVVSGSAALGSPFDQYNGLAASGPAVWATDSTTQRLLRIDPTTLKVVAKIPAGLAPKGVLAAAPAVWVADVRGGTVLRVDPSVNKVKATVTVGPTGTSGPNWLGGGLGSIWVDIPNIASVVRFDPVTGKIQATIPIPALVTPCGGFAVGADAVWVTGCQSTSNMARIDPATNRVVATVELGGFGYNPILIDGAPWVSVDPGSPDAGFLARVNPATNLVDRVVIPGPAFGGGGDMLSAAGSVWVVDGAHNALLRVPSAVFAP